MAESISGLKRSARCTEIDLNAIGQEFVLMGWCHKQRDMGGLVFITLRDRSGEMQLVIDDESPQEARQAAVKVRSEYVLAARGKLRKRSSPNPSMPTGEYELHVEELRILGESQTPPFYIEENLNAAESLRLKYRYLDLRRPDMQRNLILRHRIASLTRRFFEEQGFLEIETPMLTRSTPEGARDYLVPSRVFPGQFFALPQSPQLFKQLLMLAGYDRYMQIARCFRDEDLRVDRQPEFSQIDLEMAFVDAEDVYAVNEAYLQTLMHEILGLEITLPLPRLTYAEAMRRFGSDKPDLRYGVEIVDFSAVAGQGDFAVFQDTLAAGGVIRGIVVPGGATWSRREIDALSAIARTYRAKGLSWLTVEEPARGSLAKFYAPRVFAEVAGAAQGDLLLLVADQEEVASIALGQLRQEVARRLNLIPAGSHKLVWVTEFPLLEYDPQARRYVAIHHPFTSPMDEDLALLDSDPGKVRAKAYDVVLDGTELGGGSIRIHDPELQQRIFDLLGMNRDEAWRRFGFLLEAFRYGVPPHGGIAYGLDRMTMLLGGCASIRDVIAFPKVQTSACLMTQAPDQVDVEQLTELGIRIDTTATAKPEADDDR